MLGTEAIQERAAAIVQLIQESIDPESWYEMGGDATIRIYALSKLIVKQTLENHRQIQKLLDDLRGPLGEQIAIEARFLTVRENFLEEIGIKFDVPVFNRLGGKFGTISFTQDSLDGVRATDTGIEGSLAGAVASAISGNYGAVIDDLQANFLIRATLAHGDSKILNAPKVTVLNGESAAIRVENEISYVSDWEIEQTTALGAAGAAGGLVLTTANPTVDYILDGVVLNVTPTISADKKYVILRITTSFSQVKEFDTRFVGETTGGRAFEVQLPLRQIADVRTRVSVPDGGTLLIGGQKISGEAGKEQGVPVLSKIPVIGRLFENRSKIKDESILLILVKPTIIIQSEQEEREVAAMEKGF